MVSTMIDHYRTLSVLSPFRYRYRTHTPSQRLMDRLSIPLLPYLPLPPSRPNPLPTSISSTVYLSRHWSNHLATRRPRRWCRPHYEPCLLSSDRRSVERPSSRVHSLTNYVLSLIESPCQNRQSSSAIWWSSWLLMSRVECTPTHSITPKLAGCWQSSLSS